MTLTESELEMVVASLERMRDTSRRYAIPLLPVHTAAPVQDQLREALGHRKSGR